MLRQKLKIVKNKLMTVLFAKRKTKFGGESESWAQTHFPQLPFLPARAVWLLLHRRRGIIRDFVQKVRASVSNYDQRFRNSYVSPEVEQVSYGAGRKAKQKNFHFLN